MLKIRLFTVLTVKSSENYILTYFQNLKSLLTCASRLFTGRSLRESFYSDPATHKRILSLPVVGSRLFSPIAGNLSPSFDMSDISDLVVLRGHQNHSSGHKW